MLRAFLFFSSPRWVGGSQQKDTLDKGNIKKVRKEEDRLSMAQEEGNIVGESEKTRK